MESGRSSVVCSVMYLLRRLHFRSAILTSDNDRPVRRAMRVPGRVV